MTDVRFPDGVFPPLAATRGDRGRDMDRLLWSTERTLVSGESMDWLARGGGCTDLALEARDPVRVRVVSPMAREPPSIEERVESRPFLSAPVAMFVLRFRESKSDPSYMPGPTDFLGGLTTCVLDTGG